MRPGSTLRATFALTGSATGTPTAKLLRNGAFDAAVGVITASAGVGVNAWFVAATIPSGYASGDTIELVVTATVAGVTQSCTVARDAVSRGIDDDKGWGDQNARQTLQALAQVIFGTRNGVPAEGTGGTITYVGPHGEPYGSITVDALGRITASNLSPPT
jgi:hypothetical protein